MDSFFTNNEGSMDIFYIHIHTNFISEKTIYAFSISFVENSNNIQEFISMEKNNHGVVLSLEEFLEKFTNSDRT